MRYLAALAVSAFCLSASAKATADKLPSALTTAVAQAPAAATAQPQAPPNLIQQVRAVINKGDLPGAEAVAAAYRKDKGSTRWTRTISASTR
jgi:hypothetical protein